MNTKPSVVIADNHRLVAAGLSQLLAPHCDVRATVYDAPALLKEIHGCQPDLVVQDVVMPPADGVDVIRQIREIGLATRVIVVTMLDDPGLAAKAFRAGASAYLLKKCATSELLEAVRCVVGGEDVCDTAPRRRDDRSAGQAPGRRTAESPPVNAKSSGCWRKANR